MRDATDKRTGELEVGGTRRRGRPSTGAAKSAAERQAAFRERHGLVAMTVYLPAELIEAVNQYMRFKDVTKTDVFSKLIRSQLLRKR